MYLKSTCCKNCPDENKYEGCHSTCVKFFAEELAKDIERNKIKKSKQKEQNFNDFKVMTVSKTKKRAKR